MAWTQNGGANAKTSCGQSCLMALYVQYGCGLSAPEGWMNFDASPRLRLERIPLAGSLAKAAGKALFPAAVRYGDIVSGLPVADKSADGLYCSHILEHLDRNSIIPALANSYRVLKPGGVFRLVMPDLIWRARQLLTDHEAGKTEAADAFMETCYLGQRSPTRSLNSKIRMMFGNADHRWMYDAPLMKQLLTEAGFGAIRECEFGDSKDPHFAEVEEEGRFYDSGHKELALEAVRPAV